MDPAEFERLNATYPGELVMGAQLGTYYVLFNCHKDLSPAGKTFSVQEQSRARYALGLMINRQDEVDYVTMGGEEPATGFFPSDLSDGYNSNVREAEDTAPGTPALPSLPKRTRSTPRIWSKASRS